MSSSNDIQNDLQQSDPELHARVCQRAYEIWQETGCNDQEKNFQQALAELKAHQVQTTTPLLGSVPRNFFRSKEEQANEEDEIPISLMRMDYAIDTSGSTSGQVIELEKQSAEQLMELVPGRKIIDWNSRARLVQNIRELYSTGMTEPETIIPFLQEQPESTGLVLYSDGCIPGYSMDRFKDKMKKLPKMPVIVVLTLQPSYDLDHSIQLIERQVNMSIPEGCLAMSDDVCVVLNVCGAHKLLMTKGSFNVFGAIPELHHGLKLAALPDFDMIRLKDVKIRAPLPPGYLWLNGFDEQPLKLATVYSAAHNDGPLIPDEILEALCNRVYLPNLDLDQMHHALTQMLRRLNDNPELDAARAELARLAVSDQAGTQAHRDLIERCNQLKNRVGGVSGADAPRDLRKTRGLISKFLAMIAEYRSNNTSFVLGSNRANRAKVFHQDQLTGIGQLHWCGMPHLFGTRACLPALEATTQDRRLSGSDGLYRPLHQRLGHGIALSLRSMVVGDGYSGYLRPNLR